MGGLVLGWVEPGNGRARFVAEVVSQRVSVTIDVGAVVRQSAEHVEIAAVAVGGVVEPIAAAGMMVGIKTGSLVSDSQTEANGVARNRSRQASGGQRAVAAGLETVPITKPFQFRREAVVERPAVFKRHRLARTDAVETVVAVEPRAAAAEDISRAAFGRVAAESINVHPFAVLGGVVPVIPGVAIEEKIIRAAHAVDADGLSVVHGKTFVDVVAAIILEADRLRVPLHRHLHADHFESLQMQPGTRNIKCIDAFPLGFDLRTIEHGLLIFVSAVGDGLPAHAAFIKDREVGENPFPAGDLALLHEISSTANVDGVRRSDRLLRPLNRGERLAQRSEIAVVSGG